MITIKVKQQPSPDHWPDGWAVFKYTDETIANEHWEFLKSCKNTAIWEDELITKWLAAGREV